MSRLVEVIVATLHLDVIQVRSDITALQAQLGSVMAKQEDFDARMKALDAATDEIASDLTALRDKLAAGTIPDTAVADLDARIARLTALGKDPEPAPPADA
jgi:DNA repair ATPase RecN